MILTPASLRSDHWMLSPGIGGAFRLESLVDFAGIRTEQRNQGSSPSSRTISASVSATAAYRDLPSGAHETRHAMTTGRRPKSVMSRIGPPPVRNAQILLVTRSVNGSASHLPSGDKNMCRASNREE